ncbi:MAG: carbohydrate-binding family 9-like protein [Planctomyces sp.]
MFSPQKKVFVMKVDFSGDSTSFCSSTLLALSVLFVLPSSQIAAQQPGNAYECRYATKAPVIDGVIDDDVWKSAAEVTEFTLPWLGKNARPASTPTKAKLLWDKDAIYFSADMVDHDLYAVIKEQDGDLWNNDVFELFFKPSEQKSGYYEFEVNAQKAILDIYLPKKGVDARKHFRSEEFHIDLQVQIRGTLNQHGDTDEGWTVEGKIPWSDFAPTGGAPKAGDEWRFALCRYDYTMKDLKNPELSTSAPLKSKSSPDFHLIEDYAPIRFIAAEGK